MRSGLAVLLFLLTIGGGGCSPFRPYHPDSDTDETSYAVSDVPYLRQQARNDCGPAALASLLAHRGAEVPLVDVTAAVYSPTLQGTLLPDMENYARSLGFSTRSGRGDLTMLRRTIASGRPVLALLETGIWVVSRPHYIVVYGYDGDGFLAHIGTRSGLHIENDAFLERWDKMNRLYLYLE